MRLLTKVIIVAESTIQNAFGRDFHHAPEPLLAVAWCSAIGARVLVRYNGKVQAQEVVAQSSFYSANDPRLHFGLGAAEIVGLEVRWPLGNREIFSDVAADQLVTIKDGSGIVETRRFRGRGR